MAVKFEIDPYICDQHYYDCTRGYFGDITPSCIKHCPADAIHFEHPYDWEPGEPMHFFKIQPDLCINCGKCATFCYHNAVLKDGNPVIMTTERCVRLIAKGALKGIGGDLLGEIWDKLIK